MSTLKVSLERVEKIDEHPNAERLEIAQIKGWQVIVQKGRYTPGNLVVYIPIDSVLPHNLESLIFGPDSKVKLHHSRVKTIKLRGAVSQGMVIPIDLALQACPNGTKFNLAEGEDLTDILGVKKYEPPAPGFQSFRAARPKVSNPHFHKYTGIENFKNYNKAFSENEHVVATEKLHGTNFRCGWVPYVPKTWWEKLKKKVGMVPNYEFVFGSHNVQLDTSLLKTPEDNIYAKAVIKYGLFDKLAEFCSSFDSSIVVYGEIVGPKIQKGYDYGVPAGDIELVLFDIQVNEKYQTHISLMIACSSFGLKAAPVLYDGPFSGLNIDEIVSGPSVFCPTQKVREGVVIRPIVEKDSYFGRKILKAINPEYLLGDQTDYH